MTLKNKIASLFILIVALADAIYLTYHHYLVSIVQPASKSFCSINSLIDCDKVALSDYSTILSIPVSTIGIFAYAFLLLAILVLKQKKGKQTFIRIITGMVFLFCLFELAVSIYPLGSICVMCCLLYLVTGVLFFVLKSKDESYGDGFRYFISIFEKMKLFAVMTMIFLTALGASYYLDFLIEDEMDQRVVLQMFNQSYTLIDKYENLASLKIDTLGSPIKGPAQAPIQIIEFSDFECPACQSFSKELNLLQQLQPEKISITFIHYPLDHQCNPSIKSPYHLMACKLAYSSFCAGEQGKFWEAHNAFFYAEEQWTEKAIERFLHDNAIDKTIFGRCMDERAPLAIAKDLERGKKIQLAYTPTIFINGKKVSDLAQNFADYKLIIEYLLEKQ